jgi:hypothetical protein
VNEKFALLRQVETRVHIHSSILCAVLSVRSERRERSSDDNIDIDVDHLVDDKSTYKVANVQSVFCKGGGFSNQIAAEAEGQKDGF